MKLAIKEQLQKEITKRNIAARCAGTTQTPFSTIQRLSGYLMKDCKVKGEIKTVRQYLLTYDRKELKSILNGMRHNRTTGNFSPFNNGIKINLSYCFARIEDFKISTNNK